MPCISGNFGPAGLIVKAVIFRDVTHLQSIGAPPATGMQPPALTLYDALIDTGASATCISERIVNETGLMPTGKAQMISASHVVEVNSHSFLVALPHVLQQQPTGLVSGSFMIFDGIVGIEFKPFGAQYEILLGRDVICKGSLTIGFDGHFSFCV